MNDDDAIKNDAIKRKIAISKLMDLLDNHPPADFSHEDEDAVIEVMDALDKQAFLTTKQRGWLAHYIKMAQDRPVPA